MSFWRSNADVSVNNGHICCQYILLVSDDYSWLKGRSFVKNFVTFPLFYSLPTEQFCMLVVVC